MFQPKQKDVPTVTVCYAWLSGWSWRERTGIVKKNRFLKLAQNQALLPRNRPSIAAKLPSYVQLILAFCTIGCASPGPPHSPSLDQPEPIKSADIHRIGQQTQLAFTLPTRNTDHLPLKGKVITVTLCKSADNSKCLPGVPRTYPLRTAGEPTQVLLTDDLGALANGPLRLVTYRIDLKDVDGHSAGYSDPFFTVAGSAPAPIDKISVEGSRLGPIISWTYPDADAQIVIRRDVISPKTPTKPVFLSLPPDTHTTQLIDSTALIDTPYRYTAERRRSVTLSGTHTLEIRSAPSPEVVYILHDTYPPPEPADLTAAVFNSTRETSTKSVDLIWQPVVYARLTGYIVYRQPEGKPRIRLTQAPITTPAYHDDLQGLAGHLTYFVSAIDAKGNESGTASTTIDIPQQ